MVWSYLNSVYKLTSNRRNTPEAILIILQLIEHPSQQLLSRTDSRETYLVKSAPGFRSVES